MNEKRLELLRSGLSELPKLPELYLDGRNGKSLATDEAAVWKRVIDYRIASFLKPKMILETHAGIGIGTALYRHACPEAEIVSMQNWQNELQTVDGVFDIVDIDPFGQPYDVLKAVYDHVEISGVLMISNGEALAVWRNLRKQQRFPTKNYGKKMPKWVLNEYLPRIEKITGMKVQFFYAFPSTVRVVLSNIELPDVLWRGCPNWMWWLEKYAPK